MKSVFYRKKNKGSALVLVLIATLLIISLSTVALAVSLSNVKMAGKVRKSNSEYYDLEKASQKVLSDADESLADAENYAIKYMEMELYKYGYDDIYLPTNQYVSSLPEITNLKNAKTMQSLIHYIWLTNVKNASTVEGTAVINGTKYASNLDIFFPEAYNRLFYNYGQLFLKDKQFIYDTDNTENYGYKNVYTTAALSDNSSKNYDNLTYSQTSDTDNQKAWTNFGLNTNDFVVNIKIMGTNDTYVSDADKAAEKFNGRKINAVLSLMPPPYKGVESKRYKTRRGNPIYTNALIAAQDINFSNSVANIEGEVVAIAKGKNGLSLNNSTLTVEGNLCSGKNIDINNQSTLNVKNFVAGSTLEIKQSLFGDKLFFDSNETKIVRVGMSPSLLQSNESAEEPYYNGKTSPPALPLVFDDSMGGNTYCSNIRIQNGNKDTKFTTRNILYNGNIDFTNSNASKLSVSNTLITATSTSTIKEGTKTFDTKNGFTLLPSDSAVSKNYLNTVEFKRAYVGNTLINPGPYGKYDDYYKTYSYPITNQVFSTYRNEHALTNLLTARTTNLGTLDHGFADSVNSHLLGNPTNVMKPDKIPKFDLTSFNKGIDVSKDMLTYLEGSTVLNLTGKKLNGIIYCSGDLKIIGGSGAEINGAVICAGSITVNGNINIKYSEAIIKDKLGKSKLTQDFFISGEIGTGFNLEEGAGGISEGIDAFTNTKARTRQGKNRYVITKWARGKLNGK